MLAKRLLIGVAVSGFLAVSLGAFGAHGLKYRLSLDLMNIYQTGVQYHFYHTLAALAVGVLASTVKARLFSISGWLFLIGTLIFSGSLYTLAITDMRWLGAITPLGGLILLVGWLAFGIAVYRWQAADSR